ncbi:Holliday junction resolvase RuvX [Muriicola sp. E247]|uniref:Holliday junction resolvase RuvX n=1 Tax=Muriicola sp. E247 TaxID=3242730 RepID=UPI003524A8A3
MQKLIELGRIIALDYGKVRTGIAVTDPLQLIASGLTTVQSSELIPFLLEYVKEESISEIVIGEPRQMNHMHSEAEPLIQKFLVKLKNAFPDIPVHRQDERFTSKLALESLIASGVKKKDRREKGVIDEVSATLILQGYLERKK